MVSDLTFETSKLHPAKMIWNPKMEMISLFNYGEFLGSMLHFPGGTPFAIHLILV